MAESILKLRVDSQEYDNKLKRASDGLQRYIEGCRKAGDTLEHLDDGVEDFTKSLGNMGTAATGAKGKLNEMTKTFTDLSMEYKHLTDQEKASPFGKALSASLDQLSSRIQQTKADLNDINSKLSGAMPEAGGGGLFSGDKISGMLQVFGGNLMTKGAGMAMNFVSEMGEMVKQGIELARQTEGVRMAFERLNNPNLLSNLREATHGTVTDLELMKAAVQFNNFNLPLEELGIMLAFAQQKAKDTGQSVDYMVQSIVTGLGRKSVMILDNLGLSAAEIRDKMKETGDMTKAVGEIIREQMSKAGDYVETAADRATQANVELTNAMTRLGETFQPISDMGTSMWTSLKTGALDLLNNVLEPLINKFTALGRIRAGYANQGGNERVDRMLDRLRGIKTDTYRQGTYKAQLANFDSKIRSYQQYLADYKKWQSDKTAVGAYDRMQAFQKQTGLSMYSDVNEQLAIFQKMRNEYVQGAKSILEKTPAPSPTDTTPTTTTPKVNAFDASKIAFMGGAGVKADPDQYFQSVWAMIGEQGRKQIAGTGAKQFDYGKLIKEQKKEEEKNPTATETLQGIQTMVGSLQSITNGIETLGIELPKELTDIIGVLQTITGIVGSIQAMQQVGTFLGLFKNGGIVPHAAGGTVAGTHYSGDVTPILANAGEVVLNRAQVGNLASSLQGNNQQPSGSPYVTGEMIYLGLTNYLKSTGRGEIMTSRFKQ